MRPINKVECAISHVHFAESTLYLLSAEVQTGYGPRSKDLADTARIYLRLALQYLDSLEGR